MLDKYTHSNLVYYKHNGDDEPYDYSPCFKPEGSSSGRRMCTVQSYGVLLFHCVSVSSNIQFFHSSIYRTARHVEDIKKLKN